MECKLALVGNPNTGKSSLFNQLTGLRQHVGNYPGITTEKKSGTYQHQGTVYKVYDLPGTYSLYPGSADEEVVFDVLGRPGHPDYPDKVVVVADLANLKRGLLLFYQLRMLPLPMVLVLNMADEAERRGIEADVPRLQKELGVPVVLTNARKGKGLAELRQTIAALQPQTPLEFAIPEEYAPAVKETAQLYPGQSAYAIWQLLARGAGAADLQEIRRKYKLVPRRMQVKESLLLYRQMEAVTEHTLRQREGQSDSFTHRLDKWLLHPVLGYIIFFGLLFLVFQAIFSWSALPMAWIENGFQALSSRLSASLPEGPLSRLLTEGIVPGVGGIVIFVPQIAILFFCLLLMEESGYMSRVVFLMDKWMRPFGLNGKSMVPLMSGAACAVPAVMSARNIEHKKERLITILVTPFITCSARLPVYSLIIDLVIPSRTWMGMNLKGLVLLLLYVLGLLAALGAAAVLRGFIRSAYKSYLIMEMPVYRVPHWKNVFTGLWEKTSAFILGAGKIILAVSILLWVLASQGPRSFRSAEQEVRQSQAYSGYTEEELQLVIKATRLERSYLGWIGRSIEPAIRPLGYDWKIGIGIISSFAAREVFVPTMATIYSISYEDDPGQGDKLLRERMGAVRRADGRPLYDLATGISLLLFYVFAMQCMSTLAAVKRETKMWKWPLIQLVVMSSLAYLAALLAYQLLK